MTAATSTVNNDGTMGMISLILGLVGVLTMVAGCLFGMPITALPFAVGAVVTAVVEVQAVRRTGHGHLEMAVGGLVSGTLVIAVNVLMVAMCGVISLGYIAVIAGAVQWS